MSIESKKKNLSECSLPSMVSIALLLVLVVLTGNLSRQSDYLNATNNGGNIRSNWAQYNYLADALLEGEVSLDLDVSPYLSNLPNPYSYLDRQKMIEDNPDAFYYFDTAFYNSKYYCYFGIVPVILFYAPYKMLTGADLQTTNLAIFLCCLFVLLSYLFIKLMAGKSPIIRKHIGLVLFSFVVCSNLFQIAFYPTFYCVPMILGIDLSLVGILFWMKAASTPRLSKGFLFFGSLSMALVFGCRPQLGIGSLAAFYIFRKPLKEGKIFDKDNPIIALLATTPYLAVFIGLGVYNFARFGSFFDFGSSYNLTGFDMTQYSQSWFLSISLLLSYLFEPIKLSSSFPFVEGYLPSLGDVYSQNWAPNEPIPCGYFWLYPIVLVAIAFLLARLGKRDKTIFAIALLSAFVVLLFDCRNAGISWRYYSDFGWILSATCLWGYYRCSKLNNCASTCSISRVLCCTVAISLVITCFSLFSESVTRFSNPVITGRPHFYSLISSFFVVR